MRASHRGHTDVVALLLTLHRSHVREGLQFASSQLYIPGDLVELVVDFTFFEKVIKL